MRGKYKMLEELAEPIMLWLAKWCWKDVHVVISRDRVRVVEGDIDTLPVKEDTGCEYCREKKCARCVNKAGHMSDEPCASCNGYLNFKSKDKFCKKCGRDLRK